MKTQKFEIVSSQSNIDWVGKKVTGSHNGTIAIKEGTLSLKDGKLIGGKAIVDMSSIKILDVTDPATNAQFSGHLASDDFFGIDRFPEAILEIHSVKEKATKDRYEVDGDLTIKGITGAISFEATLSLNDDSLTAFGKLVVDRTRYGIKFRSGNFFKNLGDTLIYNDFDLNVNITAKAAA